MTPDAQALAQWHDAMNQLLDAVDAYRAACSERGYSPTAAECMALAFHEQLMAKAFTATA